MIGNVEIHVAVVVVVGRHHSFRKGDPVDARGMGNVLEGSVALVAEQLAGLVLVPHEQVEKSVVVDIGPNRSLSVCGRFRQTALLRNIGKGPVAIVPEQRFALADNFPSSAQHENVLASIVVVISLDEVQAACLTGEPRFRGLIGESSISVVMEVVHRLAKVPIRCGDVQQAVILEIVDNYTGSHGEQFQSCLGSHVGEASYCRAGSALAGRGRPKRRQRQQIFWRNAGGVVPHIHIGKIQQPFHFEIVGLSFEIFCEILKGLRCTGGLRIVEIRTHREDASIAGIAINVVVHLGFVQITNPEHFLHQRHCVGDIRRGNAVRDLPLFDGLGHFALVCVDLPPVHVEIHYVEPLRGLIA